MARASVERDRGQRPAGSPQLDVSDGRDERARTAADRDLLCPELYLQLQQMLRRLRAVRPSTAFPLNSILLVLPGLVPGIHEPRHRLHRIPWMVGTSLAMTGQVVS